MNTKRSPDAPRPNDGKPPNRDGREQFEPGKPTRATPPDADPESVRIARQQGTTQRGYTSDGKAPTSPQAPAKKN